MTKLSTTSGAKKLVFNCVNFFKIDESLLLNYNENLVLVVS